MIFASRVQLSAHFWRLVPSACRFSVDRVKFERPDQFLKANTMKADSLTPESVWDRLNL
jgi:hypothetical protein